MKFYTLYFTDIKKHNKVKYFSNIQLHTAELSILI